jgi:O-antigen ligase/tetratricopeptide (TPR) repeat protein
MLVMIPLAFSTSAYHTFAAPKFALLVAGSAVIGALLSMQSLSDWRGLFSQRQVVLVSVYLLAASLSTAMGVAPVSSVVGSAYSRMGLITLLSFFMCFVALIIGIGSSLKRLMSVLWAMVAAGFAVATYAYIQLLGQDPFLPASVYTFTSAVGTVVRPSGTLGHSNYLGNFLLYTTPLAAGLGLASSGWRTRLAAAAVTVLSAVAVALSGTRGAWLGLAAGAVVFSGLEFGIQPRRWRFARGVLVLLGVVAVSAALIALNPSSRNIAVRLKSVVAEGFTGSGRTVLWRDAVRMAPQFALIGCGPEGFRKAFLAYKSKELARFAPNINNESSHNAYLDAAISYGLPGAIAYVAMIVSSFALLLRARNRAADKKARTVLVSLIAVLAGVSVHNLFIFDQIPNGLYFFAIVALAQAGSNALTRGAPPMEGDRKRLGSRRKVDSGRKRPLLAAARIVAWGAAGMAIWWSTALIQADIGTNRAFAAAASGNLEALTQHGERVGASPDPTSAYDFLFARALARFADRSASLERSGGSQVANARLRAINRAIASAEKSAAHTLTPDSCYVLLAYLALHAGDQNKLKSYAAEALRWDPNFPPARWLMSEAHLAAGELQQAAAEARLALDLDPNSRDARLALRRARGEDPREDVTSEELARRALAVAEAGNHDKARRLLRRAIDKSTAPCPDCHRSLAILYERGELYEEAIREWETFALQSPSRAAAEGTSQRVGGLKQRLRK